METYDPNLVSLLVRSYYDIQKVRIEHSNRIGALVRKEEHDSEEEAEETYGVGSAELLSAEKAILRAVNSATRTHPVRVQWMSRIQGIGPVLASGILAMVDRRHQSWARFRSGAEGWVTSPKLYPNEGVQKERYKELGVEEIDEGRIRSGIACFETISKLWAFFGEAVIDGAGQRRKKGEKSNWNAGAKVLAWKIGESFQKVGKSYRTLYENYKARITALHPEPQKIEGTKRTAYSKMHLNNMAKRYASKMFIAHTWLFWREFAGLPIREPYPLEHGHTSYLRWQDMIDRESKI